MLPMMIKIIIIIIIIEKMRSFTEIQTIFTEHCAVDIYQKEGHVEVRKKNRH